MRAELKLLFSPEIDGPIEDYQPDTLDDFGILFQALIGPRGMIGEESFTFLACTLKWMERVLEKSESGRLFGRNYNIILERYDFGQIKKIIEELCMNASGENWEEIGRKLGLYGDWEFEDYDPGK